MGASTSRSACPALGITPDCGRITINSSGIVTAIGAIDKGKVTPDGDIAGIGVVSVFVGVTSLAFFLSTIVVLFNLAKWVGWKSTLTPEKKQERSGCAVVSLTSLCETIVLSCSDQQIFTGGAYSITLRYFKGCSITAYHYNMVANMMLLTCATHLLSLTVVRDYWRYPWLACVRVLITLFLFLTTGLLLSNQNSTEQIFPSNIPPPGDEPAFMFVPAVCYQNGDTDFKKTLGKTFDEGGTRFADVLFNSNPGNKIRGWNWYIMMLLFYLAAFLLEIFRSINRGSEHPGRKRHGFIQWLKRVTMVGPKSSKALGRLGRGLMIFYLLGGLAISGATIILTSQYLFSLRRWARNAGWLETDEGSRKTSEDDATAFGQMIPMILSLLTIFALFEKWSEMGSRDRADRQYSFSGAATYRTSTSSQPPAGKNSSGSDGSLVPGDPNGGAGTVYDVSDKTFSALRNSQPLMSPGSTVIGSNTVTPGLTPMAPAFSGVGSQEYFYDHGMTSPPLPQRQSQSPQNLSQARFFNGPASAPLPPYASNPQLSGTAQHTPHYAGGAHTWGGRGAVPDPRRIRSSSEFHPLSSHPQESPRGHEWRHVSMPTATTQYHHQPTAAAPPGSVVSLAVGAPNQHSYGNAEGYFPPSFVGSPPHDGQLPRRAT
ncbi:hypothetical protein GGTG_12711 [Gaeumannomyces tritici R3-111a-1]|uniref:Uncharacterized protein n=1 Tax=Gaeumannomyces tritici (strain R3-111a-1) TaxID=644352 RepID=J3PGT1_GAET3|nr:hypothetical protein GGTG_12711 [Gaeumannomyces tritici R3-111a-1]EJT69828.1 hypothetical protein GGTG_12711 [Gaeumannomyces tritici R3-111a-1]